MGCAVGKSEQLVDHMDAKNYDPDVIPELAQQQVEEVEGEVFDEGGARQNAEEVQNGEGEIENPEDIIIQIPGANVPNRAGELQIDERHNAGVGEGVVQEPVEPDFPIQNEHSARAIADQADPPGESKRFCNYITLDEDSVNEVHPKEKEVKILLSYDFDQTISKTHICKRTKGRKLDADVQETLLINFNSENSWMGTAERIASLQRHFKSVSQMGCILCVNSFGHQCVNRWVLDHFEIAQYFNKINQSVANGLCPKSKAVFIESLQVEHGILPERTMHIDDDKGVTDFIRSNKVGHTLHVRSGVGLLELHLNQIEVEVRNWIEFGD